MEFKNWDRYAQDLKNLEDEIWDYAELAFYEQKSCNAMVKYLQSEGFEVETGLANMDTAYVATIGHGKPVIAILGEYDALDGLSQQADVPYYCPRENTTKGHGCGHHLLGVGAIGATLLLRDYLAQTNQEGTIKLFGCPAEEAGSGKAYLAREGCFNNCDVALTWHPDENNQVMAGSFQACIAAYFRFHGKASHAAGEPHLGRSALDAVELMDIAANYLREHMETTDRLHYAITNTGGTSPNVVQNEAEVYYYVRSISGPKCQKLYERVINCAKGAALMTGTTMEVKFGDGLMDVLENHVLQNVMLEAMNEIGANVYTEEELAYAQQFKDTIDIQQIMDAPLLPASNTNEFKENRKTSPICTTILQNIPSEIHVAGSTDVGDVSWCTPTAQVNTACYSYGTPSHSWQLVAQGKSSIAYKGMALAAKTMALSAIKLLNHPQLVADAKKEFEQRLDSRRYQCLIPADVQPESYQKR